MTDTIDSSDIDWTEFNRVNDDSLFNLRAWMRKTVEAHGAKVVASGVGFGEIDLEIEMEGFRYCIVVKPLPSRSQP